MRRAVACVVVLAMVVLSGVTSRSSAQSLRRFESSRPASVTSPTEMIYSNFGPDMAFDASNGWTINGYQGANIGRQAVSQQFTPSEHYTFRNAQVAVSLAQGPNSLHVFLQADSYGLPSTVIEEISIGGLGSTPAVVTAQSALAPMLYKDTPYWLTLVAVDNDVLAGWNWNSVGDASSTTIAFTQGGSAAGPWGVGLLKTRSAFQINGTPATPGPQPTSTPTNTPLPPTSTSTPTAVPPTSTPPMPGLQTAIYLPLIMGPPYYRIAFVSKRDGNEEIYVSSVDGSNQTNLSNSPARDLAPDWSPDGRKIAFERDWSTYLMNADGSNQTHLPGGRTPVWSPDGSRIAYTDGDIYTMRADGSDVVAITKSKANQNMSPVWSPDGSWIAFVYGDDLYYYGYDICLKKSNGTTTMRDLSKTLSDGDEYSPAWSPDGRWIAFSSSYPFYENSIYIVHADGTNLTRLAAGHGPPAWSPDGRRVAFEQSGDIYVINIDGSSRIDLTTNPADDTNPVWSPDGRRIAFVSQRDGNAEIYVMNADGSSPVRLTTNPADDTNPVWSPTIN